MYDQKILALVMSVHQQKLITPIIKQIVNFIQRVDNDDQIYLFKNGVLEYKPQAVPLLINYPFKHPLEGLLKDAVDCSYVEDHKNLIFVITDHTKKFNEFEMKKSLQKGSKIFVYGPQENALAKLYEQHQAKYTIIDEAGLSEQMLCDYLGEKDDDTYQEFNCERYAEQSLQSGEDAGLDF